MGKCFGCLLATVPKYDPIYIGMWLTLNLNWKSMLVSTTTKTTIITAMCTKGILRRVYSTDLEFTTTRTATGTFGNSMEWRVCHSTDLNDKSPCSRWLLASDTKEIGRAIPLTAKEYIQTVEDQNTKGSGNMTRCTAKGSTLMPRVTNLMETFIKENFTGLVS
jgi:hypothetical protein